MRRWILAVTALCALSAVASAQTYFLRESTFGTAGGAMTGSSYAVAGTLGQASPVGTSAGATYQTSHGFWHAAGWAPLEAMVLAITLVSSTTARLSWDPVALATAYDLYRSTSAFFTASGSPWQTVSAPTTVHDFTDGIGDPSVTYFFKGTARNAQQTSAESNTVGEFERSTAGVARGKGVVFPGITTER
ncbi:fibronectin type III domain-containing protein [Candidatus Fermentibacteria bacterium]|nr:fibronectin type III domain-containing protein [Candidatus Fermentibacteria bacterium]